MQTDRMISGLPHAGNSEPSLSPLSNISGMKNVHEKSPESFANLVEHALKKQDKQVEERIPQHTAPPNKDAPRAANPRKDENPSVKQEVRSGPPRAKHEDAHLKGPQQSKAESEPRAHEEQGAHEASGSQIKKVAGKKTNGEGSDRQQVMQEFMDSMESKFGTPPTRMVEAMTKLDALDQLRTPEETASQVIDKLDLSPADAERAEAMYVSMLQKLSTPEQFAPDQMLAPSAEQAAYARMSVEKGMLAQAALNPSATASEQMAIQLRMQALDAQMGTGSNTRASDLQQQLANVTGDFFEAPVAATTADDAEFDSPESSMGKISAGGMQAQDAKSKFAAQDASYGIAIPAAMKAKAQMAAADYREIAASANAANSANDASVANGLRTKLAALQSALTGDAPVANTAAPATANVDALQNASLAAITGKSASAHSNNMSSDSGGDSSADSGGSSGGGASMNSNSPLLNSGPANQSQDSGFALAGAAGAGKGHISANKEVQEQTLQQVINSAKYIMKKGGGESVVKLTPEGLGSLHLKVAVADGKVNVQMTTASKEAKEMLEGSMKDLKSSLGAHSLKVEHIKVDVGNQTSSEGGFAGKDSGGFKFDQGREQARQAMQNFHDENSANRGFMGRPDQSRVYAKANSAKTESIAPTPRPMSRGDGRGSGLNLVA